MDDVRELKRIVSETKETIFKSKKDLHVATSLNFHKGPHHAKQKSIPSTYADVIARRYSQPRNSRTAGCKLRRRTQSLA